jgi:putative membrane protein
VNPDRARDHLANERTFLAWLRTGVAVVIFGFAIGRFAVAIRELTPLAGRVVPRTGASVWLGAGAIVAGVVLTLVGTLRYRQTRRQLDAGRFEPAGRVIDVAGALTAVFGIALAAHLLYIGFRL